MLKGEIFLDGRHDDLGIRVREAEAHLAAYGGPVATRVRPVDAHGADSGHHQAVDHPGERRLARAVGADHPYPSLGQRDVDVLEDHPALTAGDVDVLDSREGELTHGSPTASTTSATP